MARTPSGRGPLIVGAIAATLASTCCLGPLVLITIGFSGGWLANLALLEPVRPLFAFVAVVALILAGFRIFRPVEACSEGDVCAAPRVRTLYKVVFIMVSLLALLAFIFPYIAHWFY
jgi:mercuric ion transport protein